MNHVGLRLLLGANPSVVVVALNRSAGSAAASPQHMQRRKSSCGKVSEPEQSCSKHAVLSASKEGIPNIPSRTTQGCACTHTFANGTRAQQKLSPERGEIDPAHKPEDTDKCVEREDDPFVEVSGVCALV